ncbi:MAG: hypothetical protein E7158_02300 [Firmicutes bacterium]|nr:hypothetical protein [Bacillota bacterium]
MKNKILKILPYTLIIMIICLLLIPKTSQNDLYFDLKSGDYLLKYGLDFKDHFSFIEGLKYVNNHYLYNLIILFIFSIKSFSSLFIFYLSLYILLGFLIFYVVNKYIDNKIISLLISLLTLLNMRIFYTTRVQSLSYIIFYLEFYFLNRLYDTGKVKYSIYLILLSVLLVNLHMSVWIIYPVLFLPFFMEQILSDLKKTKLNEIISKKIIYNSSKNKKLFVFTFLLSLSVGILSPYKLLPYTFFIKTIGNKCYEIIVEMQKTVLVNNTSYLVILLFSVIIVTLLNIKIRVRDVCYIFGLSILAFLANRHTSYFLLIVPTIIGIIISNYIVINKLNCIKLKKYQLVIMNIALIIIFSLLINNMNLKSFDYNEKKEYPVNTVKYIKNNLDYKNIRLFNEFNYGSFLEFNNIKVFIDSRAEVYIKEFNGGKDIMNDYIKVEDYQSYKFIFDIYNIDYALVFKNTPIYYYLIKDNDFAIIMEENEKYVLFKKY